jgi:hypothetical protein
VTTVIDGYVRGFYRKAGSSYRLHVDLLRVTSACCGV